MAVQPSAPVNFTGSAQLSQIAFVWDVEGEFIFGNDAAPDTVFQIGEFLEDLNFDGGEPTGATLIESADGQPLIQVDAFEIQVAPVADFSEIFISTVQKDFNYRYSVPDGYLESTHYARVRSIKSGIRSPWVQASPVLPYRFDSASKTQEGQYRISDSDISPNSLTGSSLAPTIELGTSGFTTLRSSGTSDLEFDQSGIRLLSNGSTIVDIPTDGRNPSFQGDIVSTTLEAYGQSTFKGTVTLPTGASQTLSSGKFANPTTTPTVSNIYPSWTELPDSGHWNLYIDQLGGSAANKRTAWMSGFPSAANKFLEYDLGTAGGAVPSTSTLLRTLNLPQGAEGHALIRVGNYLVAHYALSGTYYLATYNRSTLAAVGTPLVVTVNCYEPTLLADATNAVRSDCFFLVDTNATGAGGGGAFRFRHYSVNQTTGAFTLNTTANSTVGGITGWADSSLISLCGTTTVNASTTLTYAYISVPDTKYEKVVKLGLNRSSSTGFINAGNTITYYAGGFDSLFKAPWGSAPWGWSYDSGTSRIWAISGSDSLVFRASANATDVGTYAVGYAYGQSVGGYSTVQSPTQNITRAFYTDVAVDVLDGGLDTDRIYTYFNNRLQSTASLGAIRSYQVGQTYRITISTYNSGGASSSASNTFPSTGTPGSIKSESAGWQLNGDGTYSGFTPTGSIVAYGGAAAPTGWVLCDGSLKDGTNATFTALWNVLGTAYGGSGQSAFAVPNLQQRFPLGKATAGTGSTLGSTGGSIDHGHSFSGSGSDSHSHTDTFSAVCSSTTGGTHTHAAGTLSIAGHSHSFADSVSTAPSTTNSSASGTAVNHGSGSHTHGVSGTTGGSGALNVQNDTGTAGSGHDHAISVSGSVASATTSYSVSGTTGTTNPPFVVVNYIIKL